MSNGLKKEDSAALKGVAILLMVFLHCYRSESKFGDYDVIFRGITAQDAIYFSAYAKICVSIFAFVSGFGLMYGYSRRVLVQKRQETSKWTLQHLITTLSGFWFMVPFAYLIYAFLFNFDFSKWGETVSAQVTAVLMDGIGISELTGTKSLNGTWWYMGAAIVYVILVPVFARMMKRYGALSCIALVFFLPRILGVGFQGGNSVYSFLMPMVVGMACCHSHFFERASAMRLFGRKLPAKILKFLLLLLLIVVGYLTYEINDLKVLWEYNYAVVPFFVIWFCVEFLFKIPLLPLLLRYLGNHSLDIWLIHTFIRDWMGDIVFSVREFWLVPLVIIGITLVISYILLLLKKITGYEWLIKKVTGKLH